MKTIAENIKALRRNYSLTQGQLGQIAGVTDKAVSTWENGVAVPRMSAAKRISDHFGISLSEILDDSGDDTGADTESRALALSKIAVKDETILKAMEVLIHKPMLAESVQKMSTLKDEDIQLLNQLTERLRGSSRRK